MSLHVYPQTLSDSNGKKAWGNYQKVPDGREARGSQDPVGLTLAGIPNRMEHCVKKDERPGVHAWHPSTWEVGQEFKASLSDVSSMPAVLHETLFQNRETNRGNTCF